MVRAALIGLGKMGISHCAILNAHPGVELVGVADTSKLLRWGMGKYSSVPMYDDYKEMIEKTQPDCVFVATPTKLHFQLARFCLEQGVHVFLEKPCCLNYEDTTTLRGIAEEGKLLVQLGYHNRFLGTFREVKRLIDEGTLGNIYHFSAEAYGPVVVEAKEATWRSNRGEGGGCLYDYASHVINLVQFLVGEIREVRGTRLEHVFSRDVEDAVYSTLITEDGIGGQMTVSWSEESFRKMVTSIKISGTKGRIEADAQELKLYLNKAGGGDGEHGWKVSYLTDHTAPVDYYLRGEEYSAQVDDFIARVSAGSTDSVNSIQYSGETDRVIELLITDNERDYSGISQSKKPVNLSSLGFWTRLKLLINPGSDAHYTS
ncbi:Gfo/Idh/MocA family oxidoreductase [Pseudohalioglobus sediminis]|uniref:Gfo/Idh/MocA family oxidoreductase n=1 Tax=Pseudohalioglobus sediminis TaxID=2606449 RepID=A0A5B0WSA0_9GAMM|nr:Gfo/Idh/MocA family oxidoreductase [Pseudohalioglobus sediminis]KAA1189952.1 Gfo/Idh/MocA family oxidoreductase [Pseudohalioglobus sediminis]